MRSAALLLLFSLFFTGHGRISAQTFITTEDSYTYDASSGTNYGTATEIWVKKGTTSNFRKGYLKFDLSGTSFPAITSATVRLYATASVAVTMNLYQIADSWTETGITWSNAPADGPLIASVTMTSTTGYYEWDILSWLQSQFAAGDKVISLMVYSSTSNSTVVKFSSREAGVNQPQLVITTPVIISGNTYYVDATAGNDMNDGLSPATAWKSLNKVNNTTFGSSDRILFRCGEVWTGRLWPKGSGTIGNPIRIDQYGSGSKPLIDGNGMTGTGVMYLYNQEYWEISNLEIINNAATGGDRRGVRIEAENFGTADHIYLKDLLIHHVKGLVGQGRPEKRTGGIGFGIVSVSSQETHFNDILVENCIIHTCDNQGIITECVSGDGFEPYTPEWNSMKITNAGIRNNTIYNISKNAMIIRLFENGIVERNVCYNTANGISGNTMFSASCYGTIFQYNEGYDNHSPDADGSMYDADLRSPNTIWQYSYSHDNAHGLFWTCTVQADANVICRYNISQNDKGIIFCINYPVTSVHIYNNTVYCPSNLSPVIISERNNGGSGSRTYTFRNNLIYNLSPTATYDWTTGYNRTIDYNCFYGVHPASEPSDPHKVTGDPKLAGAGTGGIGLTSVDGYKLLPGSSCLNTGTTISNNGGKDFWGNDLYNGLPDIGAYEYPEKTSTGGLWSLPGTWSPSGLPTGTSNVTVLSGTVTVDVGTAICNYLDINNGSQVIINIGKQLQVNGDLRVKTP
jgi:hypothetical protein